MKILALVLTAVLAGCNLAIAQSPYATRLPAELQTAQMDSLADVTWLQGTTPAIRVEPLLRGRPVAVDADTTVRMVIGPSATGTLYAVRTNLAAVTNAYEIQWPTIGTNSAGAAWFYTLLFDRAGYTYWSGSGALYIEETTSTASNGLEWIEYTTPNVGWANVVGDPADNAALVKYVEDHGGGSAEDTIARAGVVSNAADIATLTTGKLDAVDARMAQWLVWSDINTNYHALSGDRSIKLTNESFSAIINEILQGENSSGTVIDLANTRDGTGYSSFFYIDAPIYIGKSKGGWSCTHIRGDGGPAVSLAPGYTGRMFVAGDDTYRQTGQTKICGFNFHAGDDQLSANTNAAIYLGDCSDVEISSIYFSGFAGPAISAGRDLSAIQLNNLSIHGNWIYSQRGQLPMIDIAMPDDEKILLGANIQNNYFFNKSNAVVAVQGGGASHVAVHDNIFNRYYVGGGVGQTGVVFKAGTGHSVQGNAFMRYLRNSVPVAFLPASSNSFASTVAANAYGTSVTTNAVLIGENAHGVEVWGNSMPSAAVNQVGDNTGGFVLNLGSVLTIETDSAALSAVSAVSGRVDTVESWGDHAEAGYALSSALLGYLPSAQAATQYLSVASAADYLPLAGHNGPVVLGTSIRGFGATTNVGDYGFAAGFGTSADDAGFAAGSGTSAGDYGFAAGFGTSAGDAGFAAGAGTSAGYAGFAAGESTSAGNHGFAAGFGTSAGEGGFAAGFDTSAGDAGFAAGAGTSAGYAGFAAGESTSAGNHGFAAGRAAKGADGSFVFADNSTCGTPFNRTNRPNEFSARAAGGVYFDTPLMAVTGTVSAGSFAFGDGNGRYFLNSSGTSWLTLDGTNLMLRATNGVTGRVQMIYE